MKIIFLIESLHAGGKERRLVELIKGLSKYPDISMQLVLMKEGIHYKDILSNNIRIHYIFRKFLKKDPIVFFKFYGLIKKFKPDIIHVWEGMPAFYSIPAKLLLHIPLVNSQITDAKLNKKGAFFNKINFLFSDKIIANSSAGINAYNPPKTKSAVIYNGFDFKRLNNLHDDEIIRKKFNIKSKYVIGMVASFTSSKDYTTYINAANNILEKREDVTFLCIGAGDYEKYKIIQNKNNILFLGQQQNVESIMNICHIGVLMTNPKIHSEGISNALIEFSALEKPILAINDGGNPEIINDKVNGFLIDAFHEKDLADKIILLLENANLRRKIGENAKKVIKDKFEISRMTEKFYNTYSELIKSNKN